MKQNKIYRTVRKSKGVPLAALLVGCLRALPVACAIAGLIIWLFSLMNSR